ncbi:MAG: iron ABC transporter permease [Alistipes sp.]|nr:iron ABC transporter permease [Alistipes sp.]MBQ8853586.1 iron ABC transporter permease [Alistipes sp.]
MRSRTTILFTLLSIVALAMFIADIAVGSVNLSLDSVLGVLTGSTTQSTIRSIVIDIRLVKAIMAILAGAALSLSGLQMQTLFRNPLAGPYILGVSSGASFGVALFLLGAPLLNLTTSPIISALGTAGAAWIGAAAVLVLIIALSRRIKDIMVILILGMMLSSALSAVVEILQYLSNEAALKSFVVWTMGSLGDITLSQLSFIAPIIIIGIALAVLTIKPLNILLLGENYAVTSGVNISKVRRYVFLSTTLLAGTVTAFCGPIGFVGIAAPHLARMLFRSADHRVLIPASAIIGALMMLLGDIIAKMLLLPINTVTALMGIPVVVYIVTRNRNLMQ